MKSYWVMSGKLMAGAMPASPGLDETERKIIHLHRQGIRAIINLMEEDEKDKQGNSFTDYAPFATKLGMETHRFPIIDLSIPSVEQMQLIQIKINELLAAEIPVYIHCWGGIGRTGTVVGCYLIERRISNASNFVATIQELKKESSLADRESPETIEQIEFVKQWSDRSTSL